MLSYEQRALRYNKKQEEEFSEYHINLVYLYTPTIDWLSGELLVGTKRCCYWQTFWHSLTLDMWIGRVGGLIHQGLKAFGHVLDEVLNGKGKRR